MTSNNSKAMRGMGKMFMVATHVRGKTSLRERRKTSSIINKAFEQSDNGS